jgi:hypothetical protein
LISMSSGKARTVTGPPESGMWATATVDARGSAVSVAGSVATTSTFSSPACTAASTTALELGSSAAASRTAEPSHVLVPQPNAVAASTRSATAPASSRPAMTAGPRRGAGTAGSTAGRSVTASVTPAWAAVSRVSVSSMRIARVCASTSRSVGPSPPPAGVLRPDVRGSGAPSPSRCSGSARGRRPPPAGSTVVAGLSGRPPRGGASSGGVTSAGRRREAGSAVVAAVVTCAAGSLPRRRTGIAVVAAASTGASTGSGRRPRAPPPVGSAVVGGASGSGSPPRRRPRTAAAGTAVVAAEPGSAGGTGAGPSGATGGSGRYRWPPPLCAGLPMSAAGCRAGGPSDPSGRCRPRRGAAGSGCFLPTGGS